MVVILYCTEIIALDVNGGRGYQMGWCGSVDKRGDPFGAHVQLFAMSQYCEDLACE